MPDTRKGQPEAAAERALCSLQECHCCPSSMVGTDDTEKEGVGHEDAGGCPPHPRVPKDEEEHRQSCLGGNGWEEMGKVERLLRNTGRKSGEWEAGVCFRKMS